MLKNIKLYYLLILLGGMLSFTGGVVIADSAVVDFPNGSELIVRSSSSDHSDDIQLSQDAVNAGNPTIESNGISGAVAVFQDGSEWGTNNTVLLQNLGVNADAYTSADIGVVDLSGYEKVVISGDQPQVLNDLVLANRGWFENFATNGGILQINSATNANWISDLPGGVTYNAFGEDVIIKDRPGHRILHVPNSIDDTELDGWSASTHGYLTNVPVNAVTILSDPSGPALIDFRFGNGAIIISTQTLGHAYSNGFSLFAENVLLYSPSIPEVAVFEDNSAWGTFNSVALTNLGIPNDAYGSGSLGIVDLSQYTKVIITGDQANPFNDLVLTNRAWLETFVSNGGTLQIDAGTNRPWNGALPGGVIYTPFFDDTITIQRNNHRLMNFPHLITDAELDDWFSSVHGNLSSFPESTNVILRDSFGGASLIDFSFGLGRIVISSQTLGHSLNSGLSLILENVLSFNPPRAEIAVFEDGPAWSTWNGDVLDSMGIGHSRFLSSDFGSADLSPYSKAVITGEQYGPFNDRFIGNVTWFEAYVSGGGVLEIDAGTNSVWNGQFPGGAIYVSGGSDDVNIVDSAHPIVNDPHLIGDLELDNWGSSTHGYLNNLPADARVILDDIVGQAVLVEYNIGGGTVIITTQTVGYGYWNDLSLILENLLAYNPAPVIINDPPVVSDLSDATIEFGSGPLTLVWTVTDDDPTTFSITHNSSVVHSGTWTSGIPITYTTLALSEGDHLFELTVTDGGGNIVSDPALVFVRDTTAPSLTLPAAASYQLGSTGNGMTFTVDDANTGDWTLTIDGNLHDFGIFAGPTTFNVNVDGLTVGDHSVRLTATDAVGLSTSGDTVLTVFEGSVLQLSSPTDLVVELGSSGHSISWVVSGPAAGTYDVLRVTADGGETSMDSGSFLPGDTITFLVPGLTLGTHEFVLVASDNLGAEARDGVSIFVEDTTAPTVETDDTLEFAEGDTDMTIKWSATDADPGVFTLSSGGSVLDSGNWDSGTANSFDLGDLAEGTYEYSLTVSDGSGNTVRVTITVTVSGDGEPKDPAPSEETSQPALPIPFSNFYLIALSLLGLTLLIRRRNL